MMKMELKLSLSETREGIRNFGLCRFGPKFAFQYENWHFKILVMNAYYFEVTSNGLVVVLFGMTGSADHYIENIFKEKIYMQFFLYFCYRILKSEYKKSVRLSNQSKLSLKTTVYSFLQHNIV